MRGREGGKVRDKGQREKGGGRKVKGRERGDRRNFIKADRVKVEETKR